MNDGSTQSEVESLREQVKGLTHVAQRDHGETLRLAEENARLTAEVERLRGEVATWRDWAEDTLSTHGAMSVPPGTDADVMAFLATEHNRIDAKRVNTIIRVTTAIHRWQRGEQGHGAALNAIIEAIDDPAPTPKSPEPADIDALADLDTAGLVPTLGPARRTAPAPCSTPEPPAAPLEPREHLDARCVAPECYAMATRTNTVGAGFCDDHEPTPAAPSAPQAETPDRPHRLTWSGVEWVSPCGCRFHADDDNGSHGGGPHVHPCEQHSPPSAPQGGPDPSNPDDLRAAGWAVAVHNDYRQDGEARTFWLLTRGRGLMQAVLGEGRTDSEALGIIRATLAASPPHEEPDDGPAKPPGCDWPKCGGAYPEPSTHCPCDSLPPQNLGPGRGARTVRSLRAKAECGPLPRAPESQDERIAQAMAGMGPQAGEMLSPSVGSSGRRPLGAATQHGYDEPGEGGPSHG